MESRLLFSSAFYFLPNFASAQRAKIKDKVCGKHPNNNIDARRIIGISQIKFQTDTPAYA